eukprot:TRINITY_DN29496_c0_g2_i9.p4 TRINITY_DN29496_c0_g2~~TRINITY_DN29496_c0_g2_i9.p4  ORF type:complete len:160 (-),score=37.18 TRINITY_DN29496_c0_g2_i9:194-673(-)
MSELAVEEPHVEYIDVWVDDEGATHATKCQLKNFKFEDYAPPSSPQWVYTGQLSEPLNITFTHLPVGYYGSWRVNPVPQWIVVVQGIWWIETTDGTRIEMGPGAVSYGGDQLGTKQNDGKFGHSCGVVGNQAVSLMVIRCEEESEEEMRKFLNIPCRFA